MQKTHLWLFGAALLLALPAAAQQLPANLAPNPSFEEGKDGKVAAWAFWGWAPPGVKRTTTGVWDHEVARTGARSLKVVNRSARDVGTWDNQHANAGVPIRAGETYTVSVYMKVAAPVQGLSNNFRVGFYKRTPAGKLEFFKSDSARFGVGPIKEAGVWRRLVAVVAAPQGAELLRVDFDLHGKGTAWFDDIEVKQGADYSGIDPADFPTGIAVTRFSDLNPPSAETPLSVTVRVTNGLRAGDYGVECEVMDYWFRATVLRTEVALKPTEVREVELPLPDEVRERLFKARHESGTNLFQVSAALRAPDGARLQTTRRHFRFANLLKRHEPLPSLPERHERVDDVFGEQKLVDEVRCGDPADPHPFIEGGRGLGAKSTGAVPQTDWKNMYREPNPHFTTIEPVAGAPCRVAHGWGWFGYKLNRTGLTPGRAYVIALEYPEDAGRTFNVWNTGAACSMVGGYGFHTGRTLGDHWTRTANAEYVDYPLRGGRRKWISFFHLHRKTWAPGDPYQPSSNRGDSRNGFWLIVGSVGPSMDPLTAGAAVHSIKLYEVADPKALFLEVNEPPSELGRRELFVTAESDGDIKFDAAEHDVWARQRLHQAKFLGLTGLAPNRWGFEDKLLKASREQGLGLKIFPRLMTAREVFGKIAFPEEARAINERGEEAGKPFPWAVKPLPDIVHPAALRQVCLFLNQQLAPNRNCPELCGIMLFKHYGSPIPVSFGDYALARFEQETGASIRGADGQARRDWLLANRKTEYYRWWFGKKREFLLGVRDFLRTVRPDLKLFYFPWHSDDDYPFSCGRLRYSGRPFDDKVYVPGTNILLTPSFTRPPEEWSAEEKRQPVMVRNDYRERIAPELEGRITLEDILYGRHRDMKEFWGGPRRGDLPHLVYPQDMDLVGMFTEPGSVYASGVGCAPRLYRQDKGIVYWAPVHYRYTADNPEFLNLFRTGEGVAVGNFFPYNEETGHANIHNLHCALGVEHAGPFCMMEEVLCMAHADPVYVMAGMWEPLKRGFPKFARDFAAAYRALPAVPGETLTGAAAPPDPDVVVRSYKTDYGTYLAVVNKAFESKAKRLGLTVEAGAAALAVVDLVSGREVPFERVADGGVRFAVDLGPMTLRSFRVLPETPPVAFRDVKIAPPAFSPNGDGRSDQATLSARTVRQVAGGAWAARILDARKRVVRQYRGTAPDVRFAWDGRDADGALCADGEYEVVLEAAQFPDSPCRRTVVLDLTPPAIPPLDLPDRLDVAVNRIVLEGRLPNRAPGVSLYVGAGALPELPVAVMPDGAFVCRLEGLGIGEDLVSLTLEDRAGNRAVAKTVRGRFAPPPDRPLGFDFGAGPVMDGFSAVRNDTRYSAKRGYGWLKYECTWKGDRGKGDNLVRDYCSGKEDREWAVNLPAGKYQVTLVMVDTRFDQWAPDVYVEGVKVVEHQPIKKNEPLRPRFEVDLADGVMNFVFDNPGHLPYFALNGIIIEQ